MATHGWLFCFIRTNTGSTINVNDLVPLGIRVAYCSSNGTDTSLLTVPNGHYAVYYMKGVFPLAKSSGEAISIGDNVYWNNTTKLITKTSGGNTYAGWASDDAGLGTTSCQVNIND